MQIFDNVTNIVRDDMEKTIKRNSTTDVLLKICEALNCNINEIMESESEPGDEKKVLDTDPVDVKQKSDTESVKQ